jgi:hypothetical protein
MARKKASHPPPKSPKKLRDVIEAGMLNIDRIPFPENRLEDFDRRAWELSYHLPVDMPDILKTVEHNFKNPKWELANSAILNGDGWYSWSPTSGQQDEWIIWLSAAQVKSGEWDTMDFMKLSRPAGENTLLEYPVKTVYQKDNWGHQDDFLYTLILPTDENKMWIHLIKIDNAAINWKRFPKVLLEGA